ncbi:MAG: glycosyltransferase family 9 protein [Candidatus Krumholzibacteria bacterium]|nr:glycosyltransferase family 9 protein [Candidatus Krumholzibacteria bacterium]
MSINPSQPTSDSRRDILVVRFGSLGDLCLLGWALARLADRPDGKDRRVTLVTKSAFAPLMEHVRGIHRVVPLKGSGVANVTRLAADLRDRNWDLVIDAHNILRGHLLFGMMRRRPDRRLAKDTAARLAFMGFGHRQGSLDRTMHDRFEELTAGLASESNGDSVGTLPPMASLRVQPSTKILAFAPGAQWDTKRWPENNFVALLDMHLRDHPGPVRIFLGPREENWFADGSLERAAEASERTEIIRGRSLTEVAALLSECSHLVTNDSGLLHVAEAVGTPVLAFFGPTVREFGYFPVLDGSKVLEMPMDCRPCSRNGKRPCHRGDLACLRDISPDKAYAVLSEMKESR